MVQKFQNSIYVNIEFPLTYFFIICLGFPQEIPPCSKDKDFDKPLNLEEYEFIAWIE